MYRKGNQLVAAPYAQFPEYKLEHSKLKSHGTYCMFSISLAS